MVTTPSPFDWLLLKRVSRSFYLTLRLLQLLSQTIPFVGLGGGILFLVLGLVLIRRGGSKD